MRWTLPLCLFFVCTPLWGAEPQPARLRVVLPEQATLHIEGTPTTSTGPERLFESPPLEPGKNYIYTLKAEWTGPGGASIIRMVLVKVKAGQEIRADLRPGAGKPSSEVLFVPTPDSVVAKMLEAAKVTKNDVVYDLGCGDGRIVIAAAAKYGARGVGIDIDPERVKEARAFVEQATVDKLVEIRHGDALQVPDLNRATVVTLYMLTEFNEKIKPILARDLKPGTRVVVNEIALKGWKPVRSEKVPEAFGQPVVYVYEIGVSNK
ncbi:MAG: TIGR03000 domain-containing protein [Gemmataceae bacterium]